LTIKTAKLLRGAVPASLKNIQLGKLVIVKNNKAKLLDLGMDSEDEGERVKFTTVKSVGQLCAIDFKKHTVLVWHENFRLENDLTFQKPQKKAPANKHYSKKKS
jgi:hypothetical protein